MSIDKDKRDPEEMSVQLNEAFERLEKQQKRNEESRGAAPSPSNTARVEPARRGGGSVVGALSMLLALIAIGVAFYAGYEIWMMQGQSGAIMGLEQRLDTLERRVEEAGDGGAAAALDRLTALQQQVDENLDAVESVRGRLDEVTAQLATGGSVTAAELEALKARISESMSALRDEMGTSPQDWLLAEVEYLVRLGAQRVEMQQDAGGALVMFQTADEILRSAEGVAAFGLREALANDIAELQAVSSIDVDGIYVRLGALKSQVDQLRQATPEYAPEPAEVRTTPEEAGLGERTMSFLGNVGTRLAGLVDYRRDEEAVKPALPPKEEYYLRQNLVFKLQLAQLALLRENQAIFDNSLTEARQWVQRHFDPEHRTTQTMIASLDELTGIDITREMPDVSESLRAVRETLDRFHRESERNLVQ